MRNCRTQVPFIPQLARSAQNDPNCGYPDRYCEVSTIGALILFEYNLEKILIETFQQKLEIAFMLKLIAIQLLDILSDTIEEARFIDEKIKSEDIYEELGVADLFPTAFDKRHKQLIDAKEKFFQRQNPSIFHSLHLRFLKGLLIVFLERAIEEDLPKSRIFHLS